MRVHALVPAYTKCLHIPGIKQSTLQVCVYLIFIRQVFVENVYVPVTVLGTGDRELNKRDMALILLGLIMWYEEDSEQILQV